MFGRRKDGYLLTKELHPINRMFPYVMRTRNGAAVYNNCIGCHQANGSGILAAFPPLAGHTPALFNATGAEVDGRTYLIQVMLYGLRSPFRVSVDQLGNDLHVTLTIWPRQTSSMVGAPSPASTGRPSSPPNSAGARNSS